VKVEAPGRGNQLDISRESWSGPSDSGTGEATEMGKGCQWKSPNGTFRYTLSLDFSLSSRRK